MQIVQMNQQIFESWYGAKIPKTDNTASILTLMYHAILKHYNNLLKGSVTVMVILRTFIFQSGLLKKTK